MSHAHLVSDPAHSGAVRAGRRGGIIAIPLTKRAFIRPIVISGTKERRPARDPLLLDARRRRFDVLVVWRLDRLGRDLKHVIMTLDEMTALGIAFTSLNEGIDTGTPAGRLRLHLLAAIAEFERARRSL